MSQDDEAFQHQPVLLHEVVAALTIKQGSDTKEIYVDATYGRGGHSREILRKLGPQDQLIALDKDPQAVEEAALLAADDSRFSIKFQSFARLQETAERLGIYGRVNGILLDLGVSSPQLDDPARGFSFMHEGPLDMRMNPNAGIPVHEWLAQADEKTIAKVIYEYGEERHSRRIARKIVQARQDEPIMTTAQLSALIASVVPARGNHKHPATRSFQAFRIHINRELEELKAALEQSLNVLKTGGRLVVISFHSLEDRIVKRFMRDHSRPRPLPRGLPVTASDDGVELRVCGGPVRASAEECMANPRARSAVLRVAERC